MKVGAGDVARMRYALLHNFIDGFLLPSRAASHLFPLRRPVSTPTSGRRHAAKHSP